MQVYVKHMISPQKKKKNSYKHSSMVKLATSVLGSRSTVDELATSVPGLTFYSR